MNIKEIGVHYEVARVVCLWRINERMEVVGAMKEECAESWGE